MIFRDVMKKKKGNIFLCIFILMQNTKFYTDQNISTFSTVVGFTVLSITCKYSTPFFKINKYLLYILLVLHVYFELN